ncbi:MULTISPECIES: sensor histidine kinase [unclassified Kitasatospora]|uniref:sensor histidine kinase n=1 Tax=unclassified Kitasatospora TaxID=2633591 RepID=UPI0037F3FFCF
MARGKLWAYVASGARALGGFGAFGGFGGGFGVGGDGVGEPDEGPGRSHPGSMAGPRVLSRPELDRVHWTDRPEGCPAQAHHVQVAELVQRVLRGGGRAAQVANRVPVGLPVVVADARRLESALAGLVDHAIRRSPLGGRVLVRADAVTGPGGPGRSGQVGSSTRSGYAGQSGYSGQEKARVEIRVVDRGACELPGARPWLIEGGRPGGPVGLAVQGLVSAAGARLEVEQTPGGGLTLVLTLPVARD